MNKMASRADSIRALREHASQATAGALANRERILLGTRNLDARLAGGLPKAALHELVSGRDDSPAAALAFAQMLAMLGAPDPASIIWLRDERATVRLGLPYAPGIAGLGVNPRRYVLVDTPDSTALLRTAADCLRCCAIGAVIIELGRITPCLDFTVSRKLALAAAESGVMALLVIDSAPNPSAAYSRWQVASAPSLPLAANVPGFTTLDIGLLRHRGGAAPFEARVQWDHATRCFNDATLSCAPSAITAYGTAADFGRRAA